MSNDLTTPVEATRVDPKLLEILVCPLTKGTVSYPHLTLPQILLV